jgi:radical SAM superfamily enzyme YgiQ (UPF0313 family)
MNQKENNWEELLQKFQTPGKYLGTEWNAYTQKKNSNKFLLCFPDDYTIGMSSLGYHTVGNIIDQHESYSCERCFAPGLDMEKWMRESNVGLFSLETKTSARNFDIIGFSFHYELSYTNFLNMLDLAGLEIYRKKRSLDDPLIIGGGPTCVNPSILAEFIDLFVIGEAEGVLPEILEKHSMNRNKEDFLTEVCNIKGVYVPGKSNTAKLAVYENLDNKYYPCQQPVPLVDTAHNRLNVEINRGCKNSCRYCQASVIYGPYRQKNKNMIIESARNALASTGYDEISLTSLSATDHPELFEIMDDLHYAFRDLGVSVVMSSMRPNNFSGVSDRLARLKKGGLTFAPETASDKLKKVINKNIGNQEIIDAAVLAAEKGWDKIKLYFMVGLPGETMEDIDEIIRFIKEIKKISGLKVNITVSPLTPQPHTPFQWVKANDPDVLYERIDYLKKKTSANIRKFNKEQFILENIMVRGGTELAAVVYSAWKNGARFDQWGEHFKFDVWEKAFSDNQMTWNECYNKDYENMDSFPWDIVETNYNKKYLRKGYEASIRYAQMVCHE